MFRPRMAIISILLLCTTCLGDSFTHRNTGDSFNGYAVARKRANRTQVRIENRKPRYLDLSDYRVVQNNLGRKNRIYTFNIKDAVEFMAETQAFEKAIKIAANQGPLFILIEIDTPGGRIDLAKRICSALIKLDNCKTIAFMSGGEFGGAFSAGAIIALACDEIYMLEGTAIGAASLYARTTTGPEELEEIYGESIAVKFSSAWSAYCVAIAELNNRPGQLVKAMVEKQTEVVEIIEDGEQIFIHPRDKPKGQKTIRIWSDKNSLLTLSADEAFVVGIANGTVSSRSELFARLGAKRAVKKPDRKMLKAKRAFEKIKKRFDAILNSIEYFEQRANILVKEYNALEAEIRKADTVIYRQRSGRRRIGSYSSSYSETQVERRVVLTDRNILLNELLDVLDALIREYDTAMLMANRYPDLKRYVKMLEKNLTATEVTYDGINFRSRY